METIGKAGNGCIWLEMAEYGWKWLETTGNGRKWLIGDGYGWTGLTITRKDLMLKEMVRNVGKCLETVGNA